MDIKVVEVIETIINFIILVLILKHFFWSKLQKVIEDRKNYVDEQLIKADEDAQKARMYLLKNEQILKSAKEESKKITEMQKQKADKIYQEIIDNAKTEAEHMVEKADVEIGREKEKAEYEIKKQVVDLAVELSIKALKENIDESTHRKLISDFIAKVGM
ncbi:F0F1 ATP synthase subunit B [Clostridium sp. BJN0001]|uniref:F0F1 ATP synthase subunit B n=1 Tax=Clostridium sp. BJN0001 TaxID=2930219 RepID=UPI001FD2D680|nr:F0F1 ATP synthase subunit B [Clostridium sp. BJN0001]